MATGIMIVDADKPSHVRVGAWKAEDGIITVTYLGTYPSQSSEVGQAAPEDLAKFILSAFD